VRSWRPSRPRLTPSGSSAWKPKTRVARLHLVADRLKACVSGPEDEELHALLIEFEEPKGKRKAVEAVAEGISVLTEDLEEAA
jgi:hypothetical protein